MAGLYNDGDALRLEHFGEGKGDLLCEPFLDLKSTILAILERPITRRLGTYPMCIWRC